MTGQVMKQDLFKMKAVLYLHYIWFGSYFFLLFIVHIISGSLLLLLTHKVSKFSE